MSTHGNTNGNGKSQYDHTDAVLPLGRSLPPDKEGDNEGEGDAGHIPAEMLLPMGAVPYFHGTIVSDNDSETDDAAVIEVATAAHTNSGNYFGFAALDREAHYRAAYRSAFAALERAERRKARAERHLMLAFALGFTVCSIGTAIFMRLLGG